MGVTFYLFQVPSLFVTLTGTEYDWNYKALLDKGIGNGRTEHNLHYQRGKVLGGSSSVNYLVYSRGVPQDYDDWSLVAPGWSWSEVLYYFKKFEGMTDPSVFTPENEFLHSAEGPVLVSRPADDPVAAKVNNIMLTSYREMGIPSVLESNGPDIYGATRPHYIFANGRRSSTAEAYLRNTKNRRPNMLIAKYSTAIKLLIERDNQDGSLQAYGVEVLLNNGKKVNVLAKKEVIVSTGTINTPKLLMLSGIGPQEELKRVGIPTIVDLPVGKNMQDHIFAPMTFTGKAGLISALNNLAVPTHLDAFPVPFLSTYFKLNSVPTRYFDNRPQFQTFNLYVGAAASLLLKFGCKGYGYNTRICLSLAKVNLYREIFQTTQILLHPLSRGSVTLKSSNPLDHPHVESGYLRERQDLENLREGVKFMKGLENTTYFRQHGGQFVLQDVPECNGIYYNSDEYWNCYIKNLVASMLHAVGTCRMGPNGVVNERLKVHGIGRLRIADASIMPEIPSGNTNAPTMMIGEKAADMIKEDHGIIQIIQR